MKLPRRLAAVAGLMPESGGVADIGTDHGLIPIYLAKKGRYSPIIATDIKTGPLLAARENCQRHGVLHRVSFRLGDGLAPLQPGEVRSIIIAGMGEGTIMEVLQAYRQVAETAEVLILQPMDGATRLRRLIFEFNWRITAEVVVSERHKFYQAVRTTPHDSFRIPAVLTENDLGLTQSEIIELGPLLLAGKDANLRRMMERRYESLISLQHQIVAGSGEKHRERLQELAWDIARTKKVIDWLHSEK